MTKLTIKQKKFADEYIISMIDPYGVVYKITNRINGAKLLLRLKPYLLKQVLELNVLTLDELKHYSCQKMSSFEVYNEYK